MESYVVTPSGDLKRISDDLDPAALTAYGDWIEQGENDFEPISERLDALNDAIGEGWCPSRIVQGELKHLNDVLSGYHCAKYPCETRQTLNDAEADLATWQTLSEAARDAIIKADERADAEAAARRKALEEINQRKRRFYDAMKRENVSPGPELEILLDNLTNPFFEGTK